MSYNTRRGYNAQNSPQVSSVGQRRPVVTNNFVQGGTLTPQKKPVVTPPIQQQQQQPKTPAQNQTGINFRNQNQQQQQQNTPVKQEPPAPRPPAAAAPTPAPAEQKPPAQQQQLSEDALLEGDDAGMEGEEGAKGKRPWIRRTVKITKKERQRRRNMRLSKILQPKNAVMILNELIKSPAFAVTDVPEGGPNRFQATVVIDEIEHVGTGRSKNIARNSAAEAAIRYLIKKQKFRSTSTGQSEEGEEKMDVDEVSDDAPLPWQHVASLALFKLFSSWNDVDLKPTEERVDHKPAKNMPANPELMQPLMLLNQMLPHAEFEEVGRVGNPPNLQFTFKCRVDGQEFDGTGPNKKLAKKNAAFAVCHKVLNVSYPPDVWSPLA